VSGTGNRNGDAEQPKPASATDSSVNLKVRCSGIWTGTFQWTLNGADLDVPVDISCPDGASRSSFRLLGITVPVTGATHANDFHIIAKGFGGIGGSTEAGCEFGREFDPEDLGTLRSTYACDNNGGKRGGTVSMDVNIR